MTESSVRMSIDKDKDIEGGQEANGGENKVIACVEEISLNDAEEEKETLTRKTNGSIEDNERGQDEIAEGILSTPSSAVTFAEEHQDKCSNHTTPPVNGPKRVLTKKISLNFSQMRRESISRIRLTVNSFRGIVLALVSSVFFTLTAVIVKHLMEVDPGIMACFRFLGILVFTIPMVITAKEGLGKSMNILGPKELRHFLVLRGLAGATSLYLRYSALHYLPIANATVIVLSMPVFVCIFARIFLKEPCGVFHVIALGVTLLGIAFTAKLNVLVGLTHSSEVNTKNEIYGLVYSMGATLVGSSAYIFVRKVKEVHSSVILFNFAWVAIIETAIITGLTVEKGFELPQCGIAPWLLMILAVLSFYAQLLLTKALQCEEASVVSITRSSAEVVCAFLFQMLIFRHMPDVYALVGALLVSTSVLLTGARKWVGALPGDHLGRKLLGFVLK